jgi:hypothetical protein
MPTGKWANGFIISVVLIILFAIVGAMIFGIDIASSIGPDGKPRRSVDESATMTFGFVGGFAALTLIIVFLVNLSSSTKSNNT